MIQNEEVEMEEDDDNIANPIKSEPNDSEVNIKEIKDEEEYQLTQESKSDFEEKACSMKAGSVQGGVFALSSLALGTGAFSLPIRCTQVGCVWYSLFIILGALIAYWTLSKLIESARVVKGEEYSTSVKRILGKIPAIIIDIILMFYLFGVIIQFNVIIYSLIGRTYYELFENKDIYSDYNDFQKRSWDSALIKFPTMFGMTLIMSPVCLLEDISKMRFASMFGICSLIYSILVVVIETPWFYLNYRNEIYRKDDPKTHANWFDISKGFTKELNFFTGMATVFFVFSCHPGAFPVFKSLRNNIPKRINTVFFRSILLDLIIYLFMAICGFLTDPLSKESLIIFRKSIFKNDIFMTIAKISLALDLYLSIPANYNSLRASFFLLIFQTDKIDTFRNIIVTFPILLLATLIGAIFEDILSYISLLGGFFCSVICFLIPGCLMVTTSKEKILSLRNIIRIVILGILCLIGFTAGIITIINMITKEKE